MKKYFTTGSDLFAEDGEAELRGTSIPVYLASEVDARIDGYTDLLRRAGLALAAEEGPAKKAFVLKLYQDMHDFNTVDVNHERLGRIAELEGALRRSQCPYPIGEDHTVDACIKAGKCGCENKSLMER